MPTARLAATTVDPPPCAVMSSDRHRDACSRGPSGPPRPDAVRPDGRRPPARVTPRHTPRAFFSCSATERRPSGSRARAPRLRPRLHDRRRGRPDQPARHPPDARRGPARTGSCPGLGVATADATYGAIAAFGLGAITDVLVNARQVLGLVGGVFLLWLAWQTIRSTPTEAGDGHDAPGRLRRRLPVDPRADHGQPDDDPVVRGPVRRARRDERGDRRRGARRRSACCSARRPGGSS